MQVLLVTAKPPKPLSEHIRDRSLGIIDFDLIRKEISGHATFFLTKNLIEKMTPSYNPSEVKRLQQETSEARILSETHGLPSLTNLADISNYVKRADLGGILNGTELIEIAESADSITNLRATVISNSEDSSMIYQIAKHLSDLSHLSYSIRSKITRNGLVKDNATPHLSSIRKQVRDAYNRVTVSLNSIIESQLENAIQDDVISVRGDRLVIQIKSNMRSRVPGVVHDVSNSGQTLFIEPFSTVHQCNSWRELVLEEEREVARLLMELSYSVSSFSHEIDSSMDVAGELDYIFSRGRYSQSLNANDPMRDTPRHYGFNEPLVLDNATHPLLDDAVPLSLKIGPQWKVLVITGPNTGGKTVALKTVGLLACMQQSGIHIPAGQMTSIPIFDGIYADIGDQQSIQNSVSTFSSHIKTLNNILNYCGNHSLVLLDEIGASTDPDEGSAIATSVLEHLASQEITTIATTHHRSIAAIVEEHPLMENASFHLNANTLEPTYEISIGIPGMSYALEVAERLGLPKKILDRAKNNISSDYKKMGNLIEQIGSHRNSLIEKIKKADIQHEETLALRSQLENELDYLKDHKDQIRESIVDQYKKNILEIEKLVAKARSVLNSNRNLIRGNESAKEADNELSDIEMAVSKIELPDIKPPKSSEKLSLGDSIQVKGLNLKGIITSLKDEEVEIQTGNIKMVVSASRVKPVPEIINETKKTIARSWPIHTSTGHHELDIRGQRLDEAILALEGFLDSSVLEGLSKVRIIHGIGTGTLKQAVRESLKSHPLVSQYGPEERLSGGDGATFVILT